jgi:hypothetical protein
MKGRHWMTQQVRRALFEFAYAFEIDLDDRHGSGASGNGRRVEPAVADTGAPPAELNNSTGAHRDNND